MDKIMIIDTLNNALESGAPIKVTKKSGATIAGTVQSIKNGHLAEPILNRNWV